MSTEFSTVSAPAPIDAVPLRHPGRWIAAAVALVAGGLFAYGAATNPAYGWPIYRRYLFDERIVAAAWSTVQLTVLAMALAVGLGVTLAIMRGSPNPVLRVLSWVYLWVMRGTPVYVQLIFWGLLPTLYGNLRLGFRSVRRRHTSTSPTCRQVSCSRSSASASTRRRIWPRSSEPGSARCPRAGRSGHGAGHDTTPGPAPYRVAAGDAGDHPTHRQRGDQHAENDVAGDCGALQPGALRALPRHRRGDLRTDSVAAGGRHLVPGDHQRAHGRPALPGTLFLARVSRSARRGEPRP